MQLHQKVFEGPFLESNNQLIGETVLDIASYRRLDKTFDALLDLGALPQSPLLVHQYLDNDTLYNSNNKHPILQKLKSINYPFDYKDNKGNSIVGVMTEKQ